MASLLTTIDSLFYGGENLHPAILPSTPCSYPIEIPFDFILQYMAYIGNL